MAPTARRAAMATTATSQRSSERGAALLEAALGLALVALIAGAGLTAFTRAAETGARAEARLHALAMAENALERGSAPDFLRRALVEGDAELTGPGWRVAGAPYADAADEEIGESPLALIRLVAEAGAEGELPVRLETIRSLPR